MERKYKICINCTFFAEGNERVEEECELEEDMMSHEWCDGYERKRADRRGIE